MNCYLCNYGVYAKKWICIFMIMTGIAMECMKNNFLSKFIWLKTCNTKNCIKLVKHFYWLISKVYLFVNFEDISHLDLVFLLLSLSRCGASSYHTPTR